MRKFVLITSLMLTTFYYRTLAQCDGGGIWTGGTPVSGTLIAQGTIQGGVNVTARSAGSFNTGRPIYNRVNNIYNGFSYRSLTVIRGGANPFSSASTSFKLSTALSSSYIHFRVSDVRGDGFTNAEPQRIRGYNNGVEVAATFEDAVNGAYITSGNIINGASTTTATVQSAIRIFFAGPVDSVVLAKTNGGDYVIFDLFSRCEILLPFQLSEFTARLQSSSVLLNWKTTEAWNFDWYDIERSQDAITWKSIGKKEISETTGEPHSYQFTDAFPLSGRNFYRLKSTDTDGKLSYSSIVSANVNHSGSKVIFKLSPNPVQDVCSLYFNQDIPSRIICYSSDGRMVSQDVPSGYSIRMNTSHWKKGLYFIRLIYSSGRQESTRILKR